MTFWKTIFLLSIFSLILELGCADSSITPNYATPEAAYVTSFEALKKKRFDIFLDSLSQEYKENFGATREEQLKFLRANSSKVQYDKKWSMKILKVDYGKFEGYEARVFYQKYKDTKPFLKHFAPLKKEGEAWKLAVKKEQPLSVEEVAKAERSKDLVGKIFKLNDPNTDEKAAEKLAADIEEGTKEFLVNPEK